MKFKCILALLSIILLANLSVSAQNGTISQEISEADQKVIRERAAEKVWQFGEFISFIADTRNDLKTRLYHCKNALNLFIEKGEGYYEEGIWRKGVRIEVSSVTSGKKYPKELKLYLNGLANLKYPRVYVRTTDVNMIKTTKLKHVGGNKYECTAFFAQEFIATTEDGKMIYGDVTYKSVKCYVFREEIEVIKPGQSPYEYIVYLGDVKALETKTVKAK